MEGISFWLLGDIDNDDDDDDDEDDDDDDVNYKDAVQWSPPSLEYAYMIMI